MSDPVTHLVWGYTVGRALSPQPHYRFLGMASAVLLDAGAVLPGLTHHGWLHTPIFVLFVSLTLYGASRDRLLFLIPALATGSHLVLDSIGSGIMWLWPVSTASISLVPIESLAGLATVNLFLLLVPSYWYYHQWKATGESPLDALRWFHDILPRPVSWGSLSTFGLMTVLVMGHRYMVVLVG